MSEPTFFTSFPDFAHDPTAAISAEFSRLAAQRRWKQGSKTWKKNWSRCVNEEYDRLIGDSLAGLEDWVRLCVELGIDEDFTSIRQCKMALASVHVNIVDLLDSRGTETDVRTFPSISALRTYTHRTGKFFARSAAKQDKLLKVLLRKLV